MEGEKEPLIQREGEPPSFVNVKYRWVILAVFSLYWFVQGGIWDTWGPICNSANVALGFTPHDYDLLSNWSPIAFLATMPFFIWLFNSTGARLPVLIGSVLMAVGTGLRCLPLPASSLRYFIHAGQFLNAVAGCATLGAVTLISNSWFPPQQRITATSSMVMLGNLGNAMSYLIGPTLVDPPSNCTMPTSTPRTPYTLIHGYTTSIMETTTTCLDNKAEMRKQIDLLMYLEFGISVFTMILVLFFFKNKPKVAPSASAATERLEIVPALKTLFKNKRFWVFSAAFSLIIGTYHGWYGVVTLLVDPQYMSQEEIGFVVFVMTVVGSVAGIPIGWFTDRMKGRVRWMLCAILFFATLSFLYLVIMLMGWIDATAFKFSRVGFWTSMIVYGSLSSVILPLCMELASDIAYPVQEATAASVLACVDTTSMLVFLIILNSVKDQSIANYLVLGLTGVAAPVLVLATPSKNRRLEIDGSTAGNEQNLVITVDNNP